MGEDGDVVREDDNAREDDRADGLREAMQEVGSLREALKSARMPRGRRAVAWVAVGVLLAGGVGAWQSEIGPFAKGPYCWGAWEEAGRDEPGPKFLDDEERLDSSDLVVTQEKVPTPQRPQGSCTLATDDSHGSPEEFLALSFGPVPEKTEERASWIERYVTADVVQLPGGLPGAANDVRGMVVLPEACDVDGRPVAVTIEPVESRPYIYVDGSQWMARLLLQAARAGMKEAGCASNADDYRLTSPVQALPGLDRSVGKSGYACGIPGLAGGGPRVGPGRRVSYEIGSVTDTLQTCDVVTKGNAREFESHFVMAAGPRLGALFDGMVGEEPLAPGWRGTGRPDADDGWTAVRVECGEGRATFYASEGRDHGRRRLAAFANGVAARLGCDAVVADGARQDGGPRDEGENAA